MTEQKITAIVIAKNEEEMIGECLDTLAFVDEIVVVDNGSKDKTVEIARKRGAKVVSDKGNVSQLREKGLAQAKHDYVLYIDADERVSNELSKEIQAVASGNYSFSAYRIPRQNYYLGKNPWPYIEHLERLFKRKSLRGWHGDLHETAEVEGSIGDLTHVLHHYTHRDLSSMVKKTNEWSEIEATLRFNDSHPRMSWWRFPRVMIQAFFNSYLKQSGWRAGKMGLIESTYQAFSIFVTYAKLWEMQNEKRR